MKNITMVIPTFNSPQVLGHMLQSLYTNTDWEGRVVVVNNGEPITGISIEGLGDPPCKLIQAGANLGWMGGVNRGLWEADTEYFCMANDDLLFPPGAWEFWQSLMNGFMANASLPVGGVAPSSNYVSGCQNAFWHTKALTVEAPYLIGMLALYPTRLLQDLGGLDETLPGGDDLDLSIRVKDRGFALVCCRNAYVHHMGSQTGRREQPSYWDSREHQVATQNAIIAKHGMKKWYECWGGKPREL